MKKPALAMFVVAAIAVGLLIVLLVGINRIDEDGREKNGAGIVGHQVVAVRGS